MPSFAIPFTEAVRSLIQRDILPTRMNTEQLRQLGRDVRARSFFSARNNIDRLLEGIKERVLKVLRPTTAAEARPDAAGINVATARAEIKELIQRVGYDPEPGKRGGIEDLGSDVRIELVVKTNVEIAQGFGQKLQGMQEGAVDAFPAQELYRLEDREVPREWKDRWKLAGASIGAVGGWIESPMVALKGHEIWDAIGSSAIFKDGLDNSWPPFAFGSGMWVRDVAYSKAIELGVLQPGQKVRPEIPRYAESLI